jgi:hypothetical protein
MRDVDGGVRYIFKTHHFVETTQLQQFSINSVEEPWAKSDGTCMVEDGLKLGGVR